MRNSVEKKDVERLRSLGRELREIAELPIQDHNRKLWIATNELCAVRPLVHVRDLLLYFLVYENELTATITDPFLEEIEQSILARIYEWKHLRCDRVVENYIECPVVYSDSGFGLKGYTKPKTLNRKFYDTSKHFDPQITCPDDIEKIKTPVVTYDENATMDRLNLLKEIFDGIIDVKLFGRSHFRCCPSDDILTWTGMNEGMMFFSTEPDMMHEMVSRYINGNIVRIKQYEKLGIISSNNEFRNVGQNAAGYTTQLPPATESGIGAKITDIWGECQDQILTSVSPQMSQDFAFDHEKIWAELFPMISYGCCERLDHKVSRLTASFPNLRMVSSSPYSNLESMMEQLGKNYVINFKANSQHLAPEHLAMDVLRKEIVDACELVQKYGVNLVINMKTIITLHEEPWRLWKWCDMATEIVHSYFGE